MRPIDRVLEKFAGQSVVRSGDSGKQWAAICPAHDDRERSLSIGVGDDDKVVLICYAGCTAAQVIERVGLEWKDLFPEPDVPTLAQLAALKRLPVEWLARECGLRDLDREQGIGIPYCDERKKQLFMRRRVSLYSKTLQPSGVKLAAYGQWRLEQARQAKELILVEGESDPWTLWHHGFPAMGLPGAKTAKTLEERYLDGIERLYVWREPGQGGDAFIDLVARRLKTIGWKGAAKVLSHPDAKDPSALHVRNPEAFPAEFRKLLNVAGPLPDPGERQGKKVHVADAVKEASTPGMPGPKPGHFPLTDLGNAQRLVFRYGKDLRWVKPWRKWIAWTGWAWQVDADDYAMRHAADTVRSIYAESAACNDPTLRQQLAEHALASESFRSIHAMVRLAQDQINLQVEPRQLDANPWLLNCPNGTIDLRTGVLLPHCRADMVTKVCPTAHDPSARCQAWEAFLASVFADKVDVISYVHRLIGYCLTGDVSAHLLAVFWGTGANGKSTLLNALSGVLGKDYAGAAAADLLVARRGQCHPTEVADLYGRRLVVCQETEDGCKLNESLVKRLTGSDNLKARRMREDFWEFPPTHKLVLSTNYRPVVRGTDRAIWRRLRLIPFTQTFEGERADLKLIDKLIAEAPGILAWAVRGCLAWQDQGEAVPAEVVAATTEYRQEEDTVQRFINDCCLLGSDLQATASSLYSEFIDWFEKAGETGHFTQTRFGRRLADLGFFRFRSYTWMWKGICLSSGKVNTNPDNEANSNGHTNTVSEGWREDVDRFN